MSTCHLHRPRDLRQVADLGEYSDFIGEGPVTLTLMRGAYGCGCDTVVRLTSQTSIAGKVNSVRAVDIPLDAAETLGQVLAGLSVCELLAFADALRATSCAEDLQDQPTRPPYFMDLPATPAAPEISASFARLVAGHIAPELADDAAWAAAKLTNDALTRTPPGELLRIEVHSGDGLRIDLVSAKVDPRRCSDWRVWAEVSARFTRYGAEGHSAGGGRRAYVELNLEGAAR